MANDRWQMTSSSPLATHHSPRCTRISGEVVIDPGWGQGFQSVDDGIGTGLAKLRGVIRMGDANRLHAGSLGRNDSGQTVLDDQTIAGFKDRAGGGWRSCLNVSPQRFERLQVARRVGFTLMGVLGGDDGGDLGTAV